MKTTLFKQPVLTKDAAGPGKTNRKHARERAVELALGKGRPPHEVSKSDWEQAKRELRSKPDMDTKEPVHHSAAESEGWGAASGSGGYKVHVPSGDEEDDDGRSDTERLVERGVRLAGRDQMRQATREGEINE